MKQSILPLLLCFILSCQDSPKSWMNLKDTTGLPDTKGDIGGLAKKSTPYEPPSSWTFSEDEDKMTSKKIYYAIVDANEQLDLKFPYNGGVTASIMIRRKNGENNAILQLSKGQFMTGVDGEVIEVRFDDGKVERYDCAGSNDDDSRILFIQSASRFINKLKKAKRTIIQAVLYDNGSQQMEFNVEGFTWDH
jgi:hypothetical protein